MAIYAAPKRRYYNPEGGGQKPPPSGIVQNASGRQVLAAEGQRGGGARQAGGMSAAAQSGGYGQRNPGVYSPAPAPQRGQPAQVRDRRFSQSEQAYRGPSQPQAMLTATQAPGTIAGMMRPTDGLAARLNGVQGAKSGMGRNASVGPQLVPGQTHPGTVLQPGDGMSVRPGEVPADQLHGNQRASGPGWWENDRGPEWDEGGPGWGQPRRTSNDPNHPDRQPSAEYQDKQDAPTDYVTNFGYGVRDTLSGDFDGDGNTDVGPNGDGDVGRPGGPGSTSPFTGPAEWLANMIGEPFGAASKVLNRYGKDSLSDFYDGWGDLDEIKDVGRDWLDPAQQQAAEDAARQDLYAGIGQERDAALRGLEGRAGRGGAQGTGATTGVHNAAMLAAQQGERGLAQDAFGRKLAGSQFGSGLLGDATRMKYGTMQDEYTSPGDLAGIVIPAAADMFGSGLEALGGAAGGGPGPLPFLKLLFGG